MNTTEQAKTNAIKVLEHCVTPKGLYASGTKEGYRSLWSRDSNIALLGGCLIGRKFKKVFADTLKTLVKHQSAKGQIPNAVGVYEALRKTDVSYNTIDSTLWYLIGQSLYKKVYKDERLFKKSKGSIERALTWLEYQDLPEEGLLVQLPTTDWQDAFPHKYGYTINSQALYYLALNLLGRKKEANKVKVLVNGPKRPDLALFDKKLGYYLPWAWKDHDGDREKETWFDSLGNLLAIVSGLADSAKARSILKHIEEKKINRPYPVKAIFPPILPKSKLWKSYFSKCHARTPYQYLNAGIWPFIGGFYVTALVRARQFKKAEQELNNLTLANQQGKKLSWEFNEWLDGRSGKPMGGIYQAWSAGTYLLAYESVKQRRSLIS